MRDLEAEIHTWVDQQQAGVAAVTADEAIDRSLPTPRPGPARHRRSLVAAAAVLLLAAGIAAAVVRSSDDRDEVRSGSTPSTTTTEPLESALPRFDLGIAGWTTAGPDLWSARSWDSAGDCDPVAQGTLLTNQPRAPLPADEEAPGTDPCTPVWDSADLGTTGFVGIEVATGEGSQPGPTACALPDPPPDGCRLDEDELLPSDRPLSTDDLLEESVPGVELTVGTGWLRDGNGTLVRIRTFTAGGATEDDLALLEQVLAAIEHP